MLQKVSTLLLACTTFVCSAQAIIFPGVRPTNATLSVVDKKNYTLSNNLISATWTMENAKLTVSNYTNLLSKEVLSGNENLFAFALKQQIIDDSWIYLGINISGKEAEALLSQDGKNWSSLGKVALSADIKPSLLRVGKVDSKGGEKDFSTQGELGTSEFLEVQTRDAKNHVSSLTGKPTRIHKSTFAGTNLQINNERGTITAAANTAAFSEYKVSSESTFFSCRIKKGTDTGMTWAPGLTLFAENGDFITIGIRSKENYNFITKAGEQIIRFKTVAAFDCGLGSSEFVVKRIGAEKIKNGKAISAILNNPKTGLNVKWSAELLNGSSYIRQKFTITGDKKLDIWGLEFLNLQAKNARQFGKVPGSPVITDSFFTGIEMPVTSNFVYSTNFSSGFGCYLPIEKSAKYDFATVVGVYPEGQIRRAFNFYLERERATASKQFLHYNNWYDFYPSEKNFNKVIEEYGREMTEKRGVKIDSFVMDDGWDNYNEGLWTFNRRNFPDGFTNVAANSQKIGSQLGVWISPLGGYGGCDQRTEHARKMGLIKDKLDLSQPGYYKWYRDKCLELVKNYNVNYFKWDKAGSGVDPHFMALVRIAKELKAVKPDLYLNVTVGTWPSPFWLNHVDCTWRDGSGDVGWSGPGDKRESWLTYRDMYCYRLCVTPAPLYPINSLMHHGLVLGHLYQAKAVSTAGANFKNAARSYFGMGPNLQELYLTPELMTQSAWDEIAESVKWAKANAQVLVDAHWIGGDPGKLEVYGTAAWRNKKGTIMFRNPNDKEQEITIDIAEAFELPKNAAKTWQLKNAYSDQKYAAPIMRAGEKVTFKLKPFEVLVFDAKAK